ncbi:MAG: hypothetical protein JEY91_04855 [Spirochaetaceae bacterium]|nr:hypothetical protein [Spirochaetaceae bacterium]
MNKTKNEKIYLFITASFICCLDLFITTISQKTGFWIGAKSMVNESDKIVQYVMTKIPYGIFLITIVYIALLYILISKLPIFISRIISLASILGNVSGFISWVWYDQSHLVSFMAFMILSSLIILNNFKSKIQKIAVHFSIGLTILLFVTGIFYAYYQKNFSELSTLLKQHNIYQELTNKEIFSNNIFLNPSFEEMKPEDKINNLWPFVSNNTKSIVFYSAIDIKEFLTAFDGDQKSEKSDIYVLNNFIKEIISKSKGNYETGKILFYDYPKSNDPLEIYLLEEISNSNIKINYNYSDIYYNIQFEYQDEQSQYIPVRSFYDFDIHFTLDDKSFSRYNLSLVDENYDFLSIINGYRTKK